MIATMWLPQSEDDWPATFAAEKLDFIPDPMVMRVADLFIGGKSFTKDAKLDPDKVWDTIERNLDSLLAFFHLLMTRDRVPLIDYDFTFMTNNFEPLGDIAVAMHPPIYNLLKEQAKLKLAAINLNRVPIARREELGKIMADTIESTGYNWFPNPGDQFKETDKVIAGQLLGGLIFGGYAQVSGSDHVLQTTRASLFLELTQPDDAPLWGAKQEAELFGRLNAMAAKDPRLSSLDTKVPPTILPFLIKQEPKNCRDLLDRALKLREEDGDFVSYRVWHGALRSAWAIGSHNEQCEKDVIDVTSELTKRYPLGESRVDRPPVWTREIGLKAKIGAGVGLEAGVEHELGDGEKLKANAKAVVEGGLEADAGKFVLSFPDWVRNWLLEHLRFRNHRKILLRLALEQHNSDYLLLGLKKLWTKS